ncbi:hypothetical protein FRB90_008811 [Tulasnella sp. 427]|nr:hypothetical protein FRB90_008811 [Tulasnella sp. 427]
MPQSTSSSSSPSSCTRSAVDLGLVPQPRITASKASPESSDGTSPQTKRVERPESEGKQAPERPVTPFEAPQGWEADLDFDFTAIPGANEWLMGDNGKGCAVWSTADKTGATVKVEFQKWDW